ncbi:MAG: hypothetical protein K1X89_25595 [Myxococcaceae bacterium]|nr:hypothetical protein [Myxococcaceae bacterium]
MTARIQQAEAASARLDFSAALKEARAALALGHADARQTQRLFALIAELSASMGYADASAEAFAKVLVLVPAFDLPPNASPKLRAPFAKAKALAKNERLTAVPRSSLAGTVVHTVVALSGDPFNMVKGSRLWHRVGGKPVALEVPKADGTVDWACTEAPCEHFLQVVDDFGNALLEVGSPSAPLKVVAPQVVTVPDGPPPEVATDERGVLQRPLPWAIAAGVLAAGAAGAIAWSRVTDARVRDMEARPPVYTYAEYQGALGQRSAGVGLGIGCAVAAAASAATAVVVAF